MALRNRRNSYIGLALHHHSQTVLNMPHTSATPTLYSFSSNQDLVESLANFVLKVQKESIEKKGRFTIALSGGSLPKQLSGLVNKPGVKWDKW